MTSGDTNYELRHYRHVLLLSATPERVLDQISSVLAPPLWRSDRKGRMAFLKEHTCHQKVCMHAEVTEFQ
jgi:hypothetical protein